MRQLALLAALLLAGCEVGPNAPNLDHAMINNPQAQSSLPGVTSPYETQGPVPGSWWKLYRDPALDQLIDQARAANTDLRAANAALGESSAMLTATRAAGEPSLGVDFSGQYGQLSGEQYLLSTTLPLLTLYDAGISASYQLDLSGQIKRATEAAGDDVQAATATRDAVAITIVAETALAYTQACAANQSLAVAQAQLATATRLSDLTRRLQQGGLAISLDLLRVRGQRDEIQANLPLYRAAHDAALFRLAALTGRPRPDFPASVTHCATPPLLNAPIPVGDGAALLRRRPDLRAAERQLDAATAQIGVVTAELYPQISIGASIGSTGKAQDFITPPTNFWGFGPSISWNLNRSATRARILAAGAAQQIALAKFDGAVLNALRETATAISTYDADIERANDLAQADARAAQAEREATRLYQLGASSVMTSLDAERVHETTQAALVSAEGKLSSDQITLFLALGGGW